MVCPLTYASLGYVCARLAAHRSALRTLRATLLPVSSTVLSPVQLPPQHSHRTSMSPEAAAMHCSWNLLPPGGLLSVVRTRLILSWSSQ